MQGLAIIEHVMEHAADSIGADPLEFRINNLESEEDGSSSMAMKMIELAKSRAKYDMRKQEIETFNKV